MLGIALLGLIDDTIGRGGAGDTPRGWRGHARAALRGELSAGAIKAIGALALAAYVVSGRGRHELDYLADLALLLLATNLFNLLDLRPGRAEKALVLLGAGLCIGACDLRAGRADRGCSSARCWSAPGSRCASGRCSATPAPT